jgi:signal transduction histidine kinase
MRKIFFDCNMRRLLFLFILLAAAPCVRAIDPAIAIDGYRHDRWSEVDGAPSLIDALAQTEDGWMWIASRQTGLYRFDGLRFMPYVTRDGSRLQHTGISVLQPGPGNALWIGHGTGGVSVLRDGRLKHFPALADSGSVFAISVGADGSAWVAARFGLFRIRGDRVERIGAAAGFDRKHAEYVLADRSGRVWASDGVFLAVLEPGAAAFRQVRRVEPDPMLIEAADASVWLVLGKRFENVAPAPARPAAARSGHSSSYQSAFDQDGNVWTGNCPVGLCVLRPHTWQRGPAFSGLQGDERFDQASQLTSLSVLSIMTDREGSVWIGTAAGLDRLRDQSVHMVRDLFDKGRTQALPGPDGSIVVLTLERLNGRFTLWRMVDGRPVAQANPLNARAMARAPDGSLVLAGSGGIERRTATGVQRIPLPPVEVPPGTPINVKSIAAGNDELWATVIGQGTWRYLHGHWTRADAAVQRASVIVVDGAGRSWLGFAGSRLMVVDGAGVREIGPAPGVDLGDIDYIYPGAVPFVSGSRGYGVVRAGRLEAIGIAAPGGLGPAAGVAVGPDGDYWLNASTGLFRVAARDWARTLNDPRVPLQGESFDALDGYVGGAETTWLKDTVAADRSGRLWLAGERGLAWIAPRARNANPVAPEVEILGLTSAGRRHAPEGTIELGTDARDVEIDYAAPSLRMPQRVRFRYRMAGADTGWEDAGARRTAFYRNLAPGDYAFEVIAINESGVASSRPATLRIHVTPRLTETPWFYAACAAAGALLLALAHRWRTYRLAQRIEESFRIRVHERESIARSLHDTFLQSVQGLMFSMHALVMKLPPRAAVRVEFDHLLQRIGQVVTEGRDEVRGLRSEFATSAEFWAALMRDLALVAPGARARVRLVEPEALDRLVSHLQHDVYAIVREAVANALRHTGGAVTVRIAAAPKNVVVSVADEGKGIGAFRHGKAGHFGVQGMRERAALIGAKLELADATGGGARMTLTIPAALAYGDAQRAT